MPGPNQVVDPSAMLKEAADGFEPTDEEYSAFTNDAALLLRSWIMRPFPGGGASLSKQRLWQLRCTNECDQRLRVLLVTGATTMFALTKYMAEAFGWRPAGKSYVTTPSKGALPAGSHWTIDRGDDGHAGHGASPAGVIGSQKSAFNAAGKGAPFFHEKKVQVWRPFRSRGDRMTFLCDAGMYGGPRKVAVILDGRTYDDTGRYCCSHVPNLVGADGCLAKFTWSSINYRFLQNKPDEQMLFPASWTEEQIEDAYTNHYKRPLFDNRGNRINEEVVIAEMHRVVALPFREEGDEGKLLL